VKFNIML